MVNTQKKSWLKYAYPKFERNRVQSQVLEYRVGLILLLCLICFFCAFFYTFHHSFPKNLLDLALAVYFLVIPVLMKRYGNWKLFGNLVCIGWLVDNLLVATESPSEALALSFFQSLIPSYLLLASEQYLFAGCFASFVFFFALPYEYDLLNGTLDYKTEEELREYIGNVVDSAQVLNRGHLIATFFMTLWLTMCNKQDNKFMQGLLEEAENARKATETFFAAFSHEFRNPLNALLGSLDLISEEQSEKGTSKNLIRTALDCGEMLYTLINNVLDVSKIQQGMFTANTNPHEIRLILHKILSILKNQTLNKGLKLELNISKETPIKLLFDGTRLMQIIMNLVSNAIKFTEEGHIKITATWEIDHSTIPEGQNYHVPILEYSSSAYGANFICIAPSSGEIPEQESETENETYTQELTELKGEIDLNPVNYQKTVACQTKDSCLESNKIEVPVLQDTNSCSSVQGEQVLCEYHHEKRGVLKVSVEDTGIGICEEKLKKLFAPYQQADEKISKNYGGTGLGLFISKTIAEFYGGKIEVKSSLGEGSTFTLSIPCEVYFEDSDSPPDCRRREMVGVRTLLLDKNSRTGRANSETLSSLNINHVLLHSVEEALKIFSRNGFFEFQIILVGLNLEGYNGVSLVSKLREIEKTKGVKQHTPIFLMVNENFKERGAAVPCEASGYLNYPLRKKEVSRIIQGFSQKSRTNQDKKKVLIVDDDRFITEILKKFLEKEYIETVCINNGKEVLENYPQLQQDSGVVILDANLYDITGYEVAKWIRDYEKQHKLSEVPIICSSGNNGKEHEEKCYNSGISFICKLYLVPKPVKRENFLNIIKAYLM